MEAGDSGGGVSDAGHQPGGHVSVPGGGQGGQCWCYLGTAQDVWCRG